MSLQIETFIAGDTHVDKLPRAFTISPAINGISKWNIDEVPLNISQSAVYTIVPNFSFTASIKMWGAGGAGLASGDSSNPAKGGGGGYASGKFQFEYHKPYILIVGQGGYKSGPVVDIYTIGNGGGTNTLASCRFGGGMSAMFINSETQANAIIIAGGGGAGSTYSGGPYDFTGGAGGGLDAERGHGYDVDTGQGSNNYFGYGGSQISGGLGAMNTANDGIALYGGHGSTGNVGSAAGGGGGYFGGGGSGGTASPSHGVGGSAGGGSGYLKSSVASGSLIAGSGNVSGNPSDLQRLGAGSGGTTSSFSSGSNGRIIIF